MEHLGLNLSAFLLEHLNILTFFQPPNEEEEEAKVSLHSILAAERHYNKAEETFQNIETVLQV